MSQMALRVPEIPPKVDGKAPRVFGTAEWNAFLQIQILRPRRPDDTLAL